MTADSSLANADAVELAFRGEQLYGDDFDEEQIEQWFADEAEGYYNLGSDAAKAYGYHALNKRHGFSALGHQRFRHVLGVGSAYGEELSPIVPRCERITILEPAPGFVATDIHGVSVDYVKPEASGDLPFDDETFDLVTCLGVLHHIPNVSKVVGELFRCLAPGGYALIREPTTSMGDWRQPRSGLTKRERGIPAHLLEDLVQSTGFRTVRKRRCTFSLTSRARYLVSGPVYNNASIVRLDELVCSLPIWSRRYHARNALQKLRAVSVFYVLQRP